MHVRFRHGKVWHVIDEAKWAGGMFTLCGLPCQRGYKTQDPGGSLRLCRKCAKWLPRKEEPGG